MDITVWEGMTNNFKIEVIHFMVNTSKKFIVYNSNVEIQKGYNYKYCLRISKYYRKYILIYIYTYQEKKSLKYESE